MPPSVRDGLTRALTRDAFDEFLRSELLRAQAATQPVAIVLFDIDNFKVVDDRWGSDVRDRVLVTLSERVTSWLRGDDLLARYGPDEFAILCTKTTPDYPVVLAHRLRTRVSLLPCEIAEAKDAFFFTISIGVASFPAREIGVARDLWSAAERALQRARSEGGNRVCVAD